MTRCARGALLLILMNALPTASVRAAQDGAARASAVAFRNQDAKEWIELFNGKNLDGWIAKIAKHDVGDNFANTFRVADGTILARYDGYGGDYNAQFGHLYFQQPYSYYLLSVEYRFVGDLYPGAPGYTLRNSGVMIHSQDPRTMPRDQNFPISIEMQFLGGLGDGQPRTTGNMCSPGTVVEFRGQLDRRHCINSTSRTYDGDQWVRAEVLVLGDSVVKHIINGDTVLTYTKPRFATGVVSGYDPAQLQDGKPLASGYIALQAEGHPVDFRNVRLLNLEGCMDPRAANYKRYYIKSNPASCRPQDPSHRDTTSHRSPPPEYELVWADEFTRAGWPDPRNWTYERGFVRNQELQWYQADNARVEGGHLVIEARRERRPNPSFEPGSTDWRRSRERAEFTSASLTTRGLHSWRYGRFEMRARIDVRAGMWPAFWTVGDSGRWPASGEIDIMEYYRGQLLANVAWAANASGTAAWDDSRKPVTELGDAGWSRRFHVWRMDWDENEIRLSVDGVVLNTTDLQATVNGDGTGRNPLRQPHHIILNLAVGGTNGGDPAATRFPARYEIDYVRVYRRRTPASPTG